jgi:hypothetical protein
MPAHLSRRAMTACVATCAVAFATAAPGVARPAGPGPAGAIAGAHQRPATEDLRANPGVPTGSLAGTAESNLDDTVGARPAEIAAPDEGATTLAVVLIAAGAMFTGAGAGFAGGLRGALRTN